MSDPETVPIPMPPGSDESSSSHSWRNHPWWIPDATRFDEILWPLPLRPSKLSVSIWIPIVAIMMLGMVAMFVALFTFTVLVTQLIDGQDEFFAWMLAWGAATSFCTDLYAACVVKNSVSTVTRFGGLSNAVQAARLAAYIDCPNEWPMHWGSYEAKLMSFSAAIAAYDRSTRRITYSCPTVRV